MSWSVDVVRRHISAVESRATSIDERKLQGYNLARLCMKGKLYSEAIRYISQYLTLKGEDHKAHKLLGDIYKEQGSHDKAILAYKRSLYFKKGQQDVIIAVGELYSCMSGDDINIDEFSEWLSKIQECKPDHPVVTKLKSKLIGGSGNDDQIVKMMNDSLTNEDPLVVIKLADRIMEYGSLEESFTYFKQCNYSSHRQNMELMRNVTGYLGGLLAKLQLKGEDDSFILSVMILLMESILDTFDIDLYREMEQKGSGLRLVSYLIKYDNLLHLALSLATTCKIKLNKVTILTELRGQCYYILSQYFLTIDKWQVGVACLLATLLTPPINVRLYEDLSQELLLVVKGWSKRSRTRLSICVRQLQLLIKEKGRDNLMKCMSVNCMELTKTLSQEFSTMYSLSESFIAMDNSLSQVNPLLLDEYEGCGLQEFDLNYIVHYSDVLPAVVWLSLMLKSMNIDIPFSKWVDVLFPELSRATPMLTSADNNTLCRCDIEAFLILSLNCCTESDISSWHKIIILPEQYISLYGSAKKLYSSNLSITEGLLVKKDVTCLLSLVRCLDPLQLNMKQILILARHFQNKAEKLVDTSPDNKDEINEYLNWSKHYWTVLLNEFSSEAKGSLSWVQSSITPRKYTPGGGTPNSSTQLFSKSKRRRSSTQLFSTHSPQSTNQKKSLLTDSERDECHMSLANTAVYQKDHQLALKYYRHVPTVRSSWNQSQIFVMLADSNEGDMRRSLLEQGLSSIKRGIKQIDDSDNEDLVQKVNHEKDRIQELINSAELPEVTTPPQVTTPTRTSLPLFKATPFSSYDTPPVPANKSTPLRTDDEGVSPAIRERDIKIASLEKQIKYLTEQMMDIKESQKSSSHSSSFLSPTQRGNISGGSPSSGLRSKPLFSNGGPSLTNFQSRPHPSSYQATPPQSQPMFEFGKMGEGVRGGPSKSFQFSMTSQVPSLHTSPPPPQTNTNLFSPIESPTGKHVPLSSPPSQRIPLPTPFSISTNYQGPPPSTVINSSSMFTLGSSRPPLLSTPVTGKMTTPSSYSINNTTPLTHFSHHTHSGGPPISQPSIGPNLTGPPQLGVTPFGLPQARPMGPQVMTMGPQVTTMGPHVRTMGPQVTTMGPHVRTMGPQVTTMGPQVTTMGPQVTTMSPQVRTMGPQVMTMGPQVSMGPQAWRPGLQSGITPLNTTSRPPNAMTMLPQTTRHQQQQFVPQLGTSLPSWNQPTSATFLSSNPPLGPSLSANPPLGSSLSTNPPLGSSLSANPPLGPSLGTNPPLGSSLSANPPLGPSLSANPPFGSSLSANPPLGPSSSTNPPLRLSGNFAPNIQPILNTQGPLFMPPSQPTTQLISGPPNITRPGVPLLSTPPTTSLINVTKTTPTFSMAPPTSTTSLLGGLFNLTTTTTKATLPFSMTPPITTKATPPFTMTSPTTKAPLYSGNFVIPSSQPSLMTTPTSTSPAITNKPLPFLLTSHTTNKDEDNEEDNDRGSPTEVVQSPDVSIEFTPIVSLPEISNLQSGEENEKVMFVANCKLYRFDTNSKQWKERGKGTIKLLADKINEKKFRILMRRDQILKICCNHYITRDMYISAFGNTGKSYMWFTPSDYAEEIVKPEKFVARFKEVATANEFKETFDKCTQIIKGDKVSLSRTDTPSPPSQSNSSLTTSSSSLLLPPTDNWDCDGCYVSNKSSDVKCVACGSAKGGAGTSIEKSFNPLVPSTGNWECDTCYVSNKPTDIKCAACDSAKSGINVPASTVGSILPPPSKGLMTIGSSGGMSLKGLSLSSTSTSTSSAPTTGGISLKGLSLSSTSTSTPSAPTTGGISLKGLSLSSTSTSTPSAPTTGGISLKGLSLSSTSTSTPSASTTGGISLKGLSLSSTSTSTSSAPTTGGISLKGLSLSSTSTSSAPTTGEISLKDLSLSSTSTSTSSAPVTGGISLKGLSLSSTSTSISSAVTTSGPLGGVPSFTTSGPLEGVPSFATSGPLGGVPSFTTSGPLGGVPSFTTSGPLGGVPSFTTSGPLGGVPSFTNINPFTIGESFSRKNKRESDSRQDKEEEEDDSSEEQGDTKKAFSSSFSFSSLAAVHGGFNFNPRLNTSKHEEDEEQEGEEEEEEDEKDEDHMKYQLVSLPIVEDLKTGEENQEVMFCEKAKLFRYDPASKQWKERGVGEMKILKNNTSKKYQCIMRRDQTLKICCNHFLLPDMKVTPFQDNNRIWLWSTLCDFSDQKVQHETFSVRFKTVEMAQKFKKVFEKGCSGEEEKEEEGKESSEEKIEDKITEEQDGKRDDMDDKNEEEEKEKEKKEVTKYESEEEKEEAKKNEMEEKNLVEEEKPEKEESEENDNEEEYKDEESDDEKTEVYERNEENKKNEEEEEEEEKEDSVNDHSNIEIQKECNVTDDVIFLHEDIPSDKLIKKAESFLLPKYFYNYLLKPDCPGCCGCNDEFPPLASSQTTPTSIETTPTVPLTTPISLLPPPHTHDTPTTPPNTTTNGGLFSTAACSSSGFVSFSDLAGDGDKNDFTIDENFKFSGAGQQLFGTDDKESGEEGVELDDPEREANIHFKPIVNLPEVVQYQSGEEGGEILFNERCKLYRYDSTNKAWKERGIGNMKMIYYPTNGRTRLLMRRNQILKICCNHYITPDMTLNYQLGNMKALRWLCAADYSEETPQYQQFSIRFKHEATAQQFKDLFEAATKKEFTSNTATAQDHDRVS